jgi:hypothetical protein
MKKIFCLLALCFGLTGTALAVQPCPPPGFGPWAEGCVTDPDETVVVPYFNTRNNWSARYSITNPTDKKIAVTVRAVDVDGYVRAYNHYVLSPNDMIVSSIVKGSKAGTSFWYVPENEKSCQFYANSEFDIDEGYLTITSEDFTTFGPGGFCGNDYELTDVKKLGYEYTLWTEKGTLLNDYRELPSLQSPIRTAWTKNGGRSTDWVVNLKTSPGYGQCESFEYLVSNRDGVSFQTYDVTEPGPAGYANFKLCHKVNVVHFGKPILDSGVGVQAEDQMWFLNNASAFADPNAGWVQLMTEGRGVSIRSEY